MTLWKGLREAISHGEPTGATTHNDKVIAGTEL